MAGTVTVTGLSASEPAGQRALGPLTIPGSSTIGETWAGPLANGANVISVPNGSIGVVIVPPTTGAVTLVYKTSLNAADAGLPISASQPSVHTFPSAASSMTITITTNGAQTAFLSAWFW